MKKGVYCDSDFSWFDTFANVQGCADSCAAKPECKFFIYGAGSNKGYCYSQETSSASCPEGFKQDEYDFYELTRPTGNYRLVIVFHTNNTSHIFINLY